MLISLLTLLNSGKKSRSEYTRTLFISEDLYYIFQVLKFHLRQSLSAKSKSNFYASTNIAEIYKTCYYISEGYKAAKTAYSRGLKRDRPDNLYAAEQLTCNKKALSDLDKNKKRTFA